MANTKINKIKIGTVEHPIEDATAVHDVKTINGDAMTGTGNIELPNTPIPAATITALFEGSSE